MSRAFHVVPFDSLLGSHYVHELPPLPLRFSTSGGESLFKEEMAVPLLSKKIDRKLRLEFFLHRRFSRPLPTRHTRSQQGWTLQPLNTLGSPPPARDSRCFVLYSNRLRFCFLHQYDAALSNAKKTVDLKPDWSKGCSRLDASHLGLHQYQEAVSAYKKGLEIDTNNKAFKTNVANEINQQPSCTVLVVDNAHMFELSGLSPDAAKNTLSLQVMLEITMKPKLRRAFSCFISWRGRRIKPN
ncbi:hypothetical protein F3Y22_tig00110384pilonHSYRG00003 [Hibiscus syriacus]|uniref:Uncharacterized protein n=1 Tax=Hibiscus syriacus TaxID=106335 RepID=A0A6A3AVZ4_HIBSY|nr:hypothetical protein F3Y22_tig00110384pilonHSYRG00003 [Hibiscus syriacus]